MRACCITALLAYCAAWPAQAHHFFAPEYERETRGTIEGVVVAVRYANPHVAVEVRVRDASGSTRLWSVNTVGPSSLDQRGWLADTIEVGDRITVEGFLGRDGARRIWIQSILLPNGQSIYPVGREDLE